MNVFSGMFNNPLFCFILFSTSFLQVLIVQYGSIALHVSSGGLDAKWWGLCLGIGAGELVWQQVINLFFEFGKNIHAQRNSKRRQKAGTLSRRVVVDGHRHIELPQTILQNHSHDYE